MESSSKSEWVPIARVLRPQGRKGEVLAELLTDQVGEFRAGRSVGLTKADGASPATSVLEDHWLPVGRNAGRIVLKLQGSDSISQAELLAGHEIAIPRGELPELEPDTFYVEDLLGCSVFDREQEIGVVSDVQFVTSPDGKVRLEDAAPLLALKNAQRGAEDPLLVPFARAYLKGVDVAGKRILMDLPPGLLDIEISQTAEQAPHGEGDE